jgi:membrane protease YdiL (CAAX protease family)
LEEAAPLLLVAMVLGVAAAIWTWRRERRGESSLGPRPEGPLADTRMALAVAVALWLLLQLAAGFLVTPHVETAAGRVAVVSGVHVLVALAVLRDARSGPRPTLTATRTSVAGLFGGLAVYGVVAAVAVGLIQGYEAAGVEVPTQDVVQILNDSDPAGRSVMVVSAVLLAPFAEEVFYRGVLLPVLARFMPLGVALVLQALVFGLSHFWSNPVAWPLAIPLAIVGWGAGWLYVRTGSLGAAVLLHATFNALQVGLLFAASA